MEKTVFPEDFDGTFRFTNWTGDDFTAKWNSKAYTFKANTTSPMVILDATPLEIQHIRKKFAKELAEREFFKSDKAKQLQTIERANNGPALGSIMGANSYSVDDLQSYIQRALEPLELSRADVAEVPRSRVEDKLSKDDEGNLVTDVVDKKVSLKDKALRA